MGPAGFLAVLGLIGVWLNSLRSDNASPDPITPALLSHAEGIDKSVPLAQLGGYQRACISKEVAFKIGYPQKAQPLRFTLETNHIAVNFEVPKLLSSCILRDFLKEDASPLADIEYDPVVKKYVGKGIPSKPRDEWEREVALDPGKLRGWAIVALPENVLAGRASVSNMPKAPAGTISLEIVIAQQFWGRRLGRQVAEPLIEHAFNHQRTVAVVAEVHPENQASIKLLQSFHFADTGKKNASEHLIFELGRLRYQQ